MSAAGVPGSTSHTRHCMIKVRSISCESTSSLNCAALPERNEQTAASSVCVIRISEPKPGPSDVAIIDERGWCCSMSRKAKRRSASSFCRPSTPLNVTLSSTQSFSSTISACSSSSSTSSSVTMPTMLVMLPLDASTIGSAILSPEPEVDACVTSRPTTPASAGASGCAWCCADALVAPGSRDDETRVTAAATASLSASGGGVGSSAAASSGRRWTRARCVRDILKVLSILSNGVLWLTVKMGRPHAPMISDTGSSSSASTSTRSLVLSTPTRLVRERSHTGTRV
mmetsp:Transcript_760/g.2356  ORF Transcript_760/g.2356 Transcript_760/m.2356 type:complete len:285 (-) Transcript_760:142-996(-)